MIKELIDIQNCEVAEILSLRADHSRYILNCARNAWQNDKNLSKFFVNMYINSYGMNLKTVEAVMLSKQVNTVPPLVTHPLFDGRAWFWVSQRYVKNDFLDEQLSNTSHVVTPEDCQRSAKILNTHRIALLMRSENTHPSVISYLLKDSHPEHSIAAIVNCNFPKEFGELFWRNILDKTFNSYSSINRFSNGVNSIHASVSILCSGRIPTEEALRVLRKRNLFGFMLSNVKSGRIKLGSDFIEDILPNTDNLPYEWYIKIFETELLNRANRGRRDRKH